MNELLDLHPIILSVILAVLLGLSFILLIRPLMLLLGARKLHRLLNRFGSEQLKHVYLQDDADDALYIERLFLQDDGFLLVHVKPYRGNIFAAQSIEHWTQVVDHHSFKFPNPLYQLESDLQYLRALLPKQKVEGLIVFSKGSEFPKGKPENILAFSELQDSVKHRPSSVTEKIMQDWQKLKQMATAASHIKSDSVLRKSDKWRLLWGSGVLAIAVVYFLWYMKWITF